MPRSDSWSAAEIARVRRLRAENPGMTWNDIHEAFFPDRTRHALARVFSDSNRDIRNTIAAQGAAGDQTADQGSSSAGAAPDGADVAVGAGDDAGADHSVKEDSSSTSAADAEADTGVASATDTSEAEAASQRGVDAEEQEPSSSRHSVTDAGSTPRQEGRRRASSSPDEVPAAKRVNSAESDDRERAVTGETADDSLLASDSDTEDLEPAVEPGPRSRDGSEPIPSVEDGTTIQSAHIVEDFREVTDSVEPVVDRDSVSEPGDSGVGVDQTDNSSSVADSISSTPSATRHKSPTPPVLPTININNSSHSMVSDNVVTNNVVTNSVVSNNMFSNVFISNNNSTFSFSVPPINFTAERNAYSSETMTNNSSAPNGNRRNKKDTAPRSQTGATGGSNAHQNSTSSSHAQQPKTKKKKTAHSQTRNPEDALPALSAMVDAQIEQSKLLAAEIRKMRKLAAAILEQASQPQVKREN